MSQIMKKFKKKSKLFRLSNAMLEFEMGINKHTKP